MNFMNLFTSNKKSVSKIKDKGTMRDEFLIDILQELLSEKDTHIIKNGELYIMNDRKKCNLVISRNQYIIMDTGNDHALPVSVNGNVYFKMLDMVNARVSEITKEIRNAVEDKNLNFLHKFLTKIKNG